MSTASLTYPESLPDQPRLAADRAENLLRNFCIVAGIAAVLMVIGLFLDDSPGKSRFLFSYLFGYVLCLDISLGALFWVLIHHVADAGWSTVIRRIFENMTRTLVVLAGLFLPIAISVLAEDGGLYKWADAEACASDPLWQKKQAYLNPVFFIFRFAVFFAIWLAYSITLRKWSLQQDETGDVRLSRSMQWLAPSGVLLLGLTATFTAFDLIMSLNYTWFSTIFGVYFWAGGIRGSMTTCILIVLALRSAGYLRNTVTSEHLHDMGKLMFGFTVFWTYIAFSQYFLIWYGNIPEETQWYARRREGDWFFMSIFLPICYFVIPFFLLLPRANKRNPLTIGIASAWILFFHMYDLYWQIQPELSDRVGGAVKGEIPLRMTDLASVVMFLSILGICTLWGLKQYPIIPIRDPRLQESIHFENDEFGD